MSPSPAERPSGLRRLGPTLRLMLTVQLCVLAALMPLRPTLGLYARLALLVGFLALARLPVRTLALRLIPLGAFAIGVLAVMAALPSRQVGPIVELPLWGIRLPEDGLRFLAAFLAKSGLLVALATAAGRLLSVHEFLVALNALPVPPRLATLCYLILASLRSVADEVHRLLRARTSRGEARLWRRLRSSASIAGILILRVARRSEVQACALCARGFAGHLPTLAVDQPGSRGWAALAGVAAALAGLALL